MSRWNAETRHRASVAISHWWWGFSAHELAWMVVLLGAAMLGGLLMR